jgi:hypothetical protein
MELDKTRFANKQSIITSAANAGAGMNSGATLTYDNLAASYFLTVK